MTLFATLLLAHCLADFPLQTSLMISLKEKSSWGVLLHVLVHIAVTWALLGFASHMVPLVVGVGLIHFVIDLLKYQSNSTQTVRLFIFDQIAHLVCLLTATGVALLVNNAHPAFVLPLTILYPALLTALSLASMVLYWVWANSLQDEIVERFRHLRWCRQQLLIIEQRTGFALICFMSIGTYISHR